MKEEYVDIVDGNDKVLGQIERKKSDKQKLRQRISRILIFNSENKILIQKRTPTKSTYPNHWDFGVAETVQAGEDYDSTAIRGLKEELDINVKNVPKFLFKMNFDNDLIKRNYQIYHIIYDGKMKFQKKEISEIRFVTKEELRKMEKENERFGPSGLASYKKYLEEYHGK